MMESGGKCQQICRPELLAAASGGAARAGLQAKLRLLLAAPGGKAVHRAARPWQLRRPIGTSALLKTLALPLPQAV